MEECKSYVGEHMDIWQQFIYSLLEGSLILMMSIQQCKYLLKSWNWWMFYSIYILPVSRELNLNNYLVWWVVKSSPWPMATSIIRSWDWLVSLKIRNPAYSNSNAFYITHCLYCTARTTFPAHSLCYCLCCDHISYKYQLCASFFHGYSISWV